MPLTPTLVHNSFPSAVQSTSATKAVSLSSNSLINRSQAGFIFLQCPHQGARNLMKTAFPAVSLSQLAGVSSIPKTVSAVSAHTKMFIVGVEPNKIDEVFSKLVAADPPRHLPQSPHLQLSSF